MDIDGLQVLLEKHFDSNKEAHTRLEEGLNRLNGRIRWVEKIAYVAIGASLIGGGGTALRVLAAVVK